MFRIEYIGHCPYCNKQVIGKDEYAAHLIEETASAIAALNAGLTDLKKVGQNYEIVCNKSFLNNVTYLTLQKLDK